MNVSPKPSYQMGNTPPLQMPICNIPSFSSKKMSLQHPKMEARTTAIKVIN